MLVPMKQLTLRQLSEERDAKDEWIREQADKAMREVEDSERFVKALSLLAHDKKEIALLDGAEELLLMLNGLHNNDEDCANDEYAMRMNIRNMIQILPFSYGEIEEELQRVIKEENDDEW